MRQPELEQTLAHPGRRCPKGTQMSRTDKTTPRWVQMMWHHTYLEARHACADVCDLPDRQSPGRTTCTWQETPAGWAAARHSCTWCSDQVGRKAKARRERYAGRLAAKRWDW